MKLNSFNVLDRQQKIRQNYVLEASAGTGKTFAIENIVVRLILEGTLLEEILVVTFTKAATRDLKERIRNNIEKMCAYFHGCGSANDIPDYLIAYFEQGEEFFPILKSRLQRAIYAFDQANIFTIHGFCSRMLRDHPLESKFSLNFRDEQITDQMLLGIIRDYFRTSEDAYTHDQLAILLKESKNSIEVLEQDLLETIKKGVEIKKCHDLDPIYQQFLEVMRGFDQHYSSERIIADFLIQAPYYKGFIKKIKPEDLEKVKRFAHMFDKQTWDRSDFNLLLKDGLFIAEALNEANLKDKKPSETSLHYPNFLETIKKTLAPIIQQAIHPNAIFSRLAHGCQTLLEAFLEKEDLLTYDKLLKVMSRAVQNHTFAQKIRKKFQAVIIDEFQDTDPIQWNIFKTLFIDPQLFSGHLYLVGDPKQSIYAFRQADIYTYLDAANRIGHNHRATLDTNFRSHSSLVNALNQLFKSAPGMMELPRINSGLEYRLVKSSQKNDNINLSDSRGAVEFSLVPSDIEISLEEAEELLIFPHYASELIRLKNDENISLDQCAFLVSDRFQAQRLLAYLEKQKIPAILKKNASIFESHAFTALYDVINAVIHLNQENLIKIAMGSRILGLTTEQLGHFDSDNMEQFMAKFRQWHDTFYSKGFGTFYHEMLQTKWISHSQTIVEGILSKKEGIKFYNELSQLAYMLIDGQKMSSSPEDMLKFLQDMAQNSSNEEFAIQKSIELGNQAVNIITLHASKGLEFAVVFAIGLVKRTKSISHFMVKQKDTGESYLQPILDEDSLDYKRYCEEIDAEKMRQLYVAMTRAKFRVYVPVYLYKSFPQIGCASPLELFLARLDQPSIEQKVIYERLGKHQEAILTQFIDKQASDIKISYHYLSEAKPASKMENEERPLMKLKEPLQPKIPSRQKAIHSFTTLSAGQSKVRMTVSPDDSEEKNAHTLPLGNETGIILHTLFEKIPFEISGSEAIREFARPYILATHLAEWEDVIVDIVDNALNSEIKCGVNSFKLRQVKNHQMFREMEFLYSSKNGDVQNYLKGVIDLTLEYAGRYYIVDWKSNWLGPNDDFYSSDRMNEAMLQNNYFLQIEIYKEALKKYLKLFDQRPFEQVFGGTYYLFLRGLNKVNANGIFYVL